MVHSVHTLDLNFQNRKNAISAYLIPHTEGALLVESGPGSTTAALQKGLETHGMKIGDITHVLLSHIHLDHAGAAGWLAQQGVQVCVHPVGAPHMLNPEKLITSATQIYKDKMDSLWGKFLAVPEDQLTILEDGQKILVGDLEITAIHTPGHAEHHIAYGIEDDIVFTGDIGGMRMPGTNYIILPLVPPELHLEKWRASLEKLLSLNFNRVAPTHSAIFDNAEEHLQLTIAAVDDAARLVDEVMPTEPSTEEFIRIIEVMVREQAIANGASEEALNTLLITNPLYISAAGLMRYWKKFRQTLN